MKEIRSIICNSPRVRDRDGSSQEPLASSEDVLEVHEVLAHLLLVDRMHIRILDDLGHDLDGLDWPKESGQMMKYIYCYGMWIGTTQ